MRQLSSPTCRCPRSTASVCRLPQMEASRLRRVAENERFIREANEEAELVAVDEAGRKAHLDSVEVEFHCACGRPECDDTIVMSVAEYLSVHEAPHRFVVAPGHDTP